MCIELLPSLYMNLINIISQAMYQILHLWHNKIRQIKNYGENMWEGQKQHTMQQQLKYKKKEWNQGPVGHSKVHHIQNYIDSKIRVRRNASFQIAILPHSKLSGNNEWNQYEIFLWGQCKRFSYVFFATAWIKWHRNSAGYQVWLLNT